MGAVLEQIVVILSPLIWPRCESTFAKRQAGPACCFRQFGTALTQGIVSSCSRKAPSHDVLEKLRVMMFSSEAPRGQA